MKYETIITKGSACDGVWPIWFKVGLFRAGKGKWGGKFDLVVKVRPMVIIYLYVPRVLKFWLSIERDVISVAYGGFIKQQRRPFYE